MVVAGLITGNQGKELAMSDTTRDYLLKFWEVINEILNAILFMLIGLEIIFISFQFKYISIGLILAVLLIAIRYVSLWVPSALFRLETTLEDRALRIMTWGGLRGGISAALALSLPNDPYKNILVSVTFVIIIFSVVVQGVSIKRLVRHQAMR
jgi:CPA1 family monovalent cation:H+ antiporter